MKIRHRLALIFTLSAAIVLIGLSLFIFFFSADFRNEEFFERLGERIEITEKLYVEADRLDPKVLQEIRDKFLHTLEKETEHVILIPEKHQAIQDSLSILFPPGFIEAVFQHQYAEFSIGDLQGAGRLYHDPKGDYLIIVAAEDVFGIRKLTNLKGILLVGLVACLLLLYPISLAAARRAMAPITQKIKKAQKITASNLHLRLNVHNEKDEIGQLAMTFNQMLDRLETAFEMQKNFISNASHEIRNPITAIQGESEVVLKKARSPEEYQEAMKLIHGESQRLGALVTALLDLAKTGFEEALSNLTEIRLDELLMEILSELSNRTLPIKIHFHSEDLPEDPDLLLLQGNAPLLRIALMNLLENAAKFSNYKRVDLWLRVKQGQLEVVIQDRGIGIPAEDLDHILEPFYRAPNARSFKGFGIGLAMTDRILHLHGGTLTFSSREGEGTSARVGFQGENCKF